MNDIPQIQPQKRPIDAAKAKIIEAKAKEHSQKIEEQTRKALAAAQIAEAERRALEDLIASASEEIAQQKAILETL